jgi:pyruvate dehydrogenase E1 component
MRILAEQLNPWIPGGLFALGTDGMGRSESREALRRHFEVDAECITLAALTQLAKREKFDRAKLPGVIKELNINPEKPSALYA